MSKAEIAALSAQSRTAYANYLNALIDVAYKTRGKLELVDRIADVVGRVIDGAPRVAGAARAGDAFTNSVTIRCYMSRAEADSLRASEKFAQGPRSFEQQKWFFTDGAAYGTQRRCRLRLLADGDRAAWNHSQNLRPCQRQPARDDRGYSIQAGRSEQRGAG
ncbi:hypothetical protein [Chromobacterium sp. ASV23]|uniref:hypothetical protein n=1 Tax=Chromobacterium sp. ASV23 TaxID=2795110 RepID=UPI0018EC5CCD|nr:hypothetical protein [Chromobacterium sp. ASV23]